MSTRALSLLAIAGLWLSGAAAVAQIAPRFEQRVETQQALIGRIGNVVAPKSGVVTYVVDYTTRQSWDGLTWVSESETRHVYSGMRRSESREYESNGTSWVASGRTTYYDNGYIHSFEEWDASTETYTPREQLSYNFAYDLNMQRMVLEGSTTQVWSGSGWEDSERTTYTVEMQSSGGLQVVGGMTEMWNGSAWDPTDRFTLEEVSGDVVQTSQNWTGMEWINSDRVIYTGVTIPDLYEQLGNRTAQYADFLDLNLSFQIIPDHVYQVWDGADWMNDSRKIVEFFHFPTGNPSTFLFQIWDGSDWANDTRQEILYVANAGSYRPGSSSLEFYDEGQWLDLFVEQYSYDGLGLLSEAVLQANLGFGLENYARYLYGWIGLGVGKDDSGSLPKVHVLAPAYPNPFNPTTNITYELASVDDVRIRVYDVLGRAVRTLVDARQNAGSYRIGFDASGLPSGLYTIRLETSSVTVSRPVTLLK